MLKITIDNEEVVSNKDFTIEEEMLNTSSVILNNVYPKAWETSKDYTTNFYHPNDYSKCLITDETDNPGEPGSNVSGSSFNINVDTSKEYSFKLTGQNGVVSGRQNIKVCGKNWFDSDMEEGQYNNSGAKASGSTAIRNATPIIVNPSTQYIFSNNGNGLAFNLFEYDKEYNFLQKTSVSGNTAFTTTANTRYVNIYRNNNQSSYNIQLQLGASISSYEAYNGFTYNINLGKNLFNYTDFSSRIQTFTTSGNENQFEVNGNGTYDYPISLTGTFTISGSWSTTNLNGHVRLVYTDDSTLNLFSSYSGSSTSGEINKTTTKNVKAIRFQTYASSQITINNLQIEKGSLATTYAPYFTPIELEATTDEIYKSGNKWYTKINGTSTEITNSSLKSSLNNIRLLNGTNNLSIVSPYLPLSMNLHYNYITPGTNVDLLFCGVVKNSGNISLNPRDPHYQTLQILDFKTFLSEGETLDFVIANKTIEEAIDQVISTISPYGFVKGNINILGADTTIGAYSTKDKTAYDVFNYLADITQSRWTTRAIDENTVAIDFYDPTLLPQGTAINYTQQWFENNLIDDMTYNYGSNDYRNKQVMTSNQVIGSLLQSQVAYANGYQTQFLTEITIATIDSIYVNNVQKSVATNEQKNIGVEADFYYTPGNNIIESAITYTTGNTIEINYLPIVEGRQIITNNDEITRVSTATGRKGVVARYENRNDATTSNELRLIGQSYIKYKGTPEIKLTIQTRSNIWNIGDRVQFNAPITELDTEYMVKSKKTNYIATIDTIFYTFELTSSFNMEQDINYFDNQRAKAKGNIDQGSYITRNIDIENTANIIFYDAEIEQVQVVGDNVLNSVLNSPFNN